MSDNNIDTTEAKQNRRKRRWGAITTTTTTETNTTTGTAGSTASLSGVVVPGISPVNNNTNYKNDNATIKTTLDTSVPVVHQKTLTTAADEARAKVLALQESVKARLAAARAAAAASTTASAAGGQGLALSSTAVGTTTSLQGSTTTQQTQEIRRPKSALFQSSSSSSATGSITTTTGTTTTGAQVLSSSVVPQPTQKKARHFELDLTVTAPSYKENSTTSIGGNNETSLKVKLSKSTNNSVVQPEKKKKPEYTKKPSNPYLAHHHTEKSSEILDTKVNNDDTTNITTSTEYDINDDNNNTDTNDPRLVRAAKSRSRNKGFAFIEPGTWINRASKIRSNQAKLIESGFLSGRKKGHTIQGATMITSSSSNNNNYYGGGSDIVDDSSHIQLPHRVDTNPDLVSLPPYFMEWWDMELLPSKLRKQITILEQEKGDDENEVITKTLVPQKASAKQQKQQQSLSTDDHDSMEVENSSTNADLLHEEESSVTPETQMMSEEEEKIYGTRRIQELRALCYQQASLSYSKTAELVQHIVPIRPKIVTPAGSDGTTTATQQQLQPSIVLHLTKKEMKRQRKLRRQEKQREMQDLQAAGLIAAPEPRLTLSNFFQVLGNTAVTDPSQIESVVQKQIALRLQQHKERNELNKLTKEQRSLKKQQQLIKLDNNAIIKQQITIALFYVNDVSHPYHRTKIDLNAQQLNLTGGVVECKQQIISNNRSNPINCVVVEGNPKSIKKFIRLMTVRMKWTGPDDDYEDDDDNNNMIGLDGTNADGGVEGIPSTRKFNPNNYCKLIWTGLAMKRNFHGFIFQECDTIQQGRKIFKSRGVEQYWEQIIQVATTSSLSSGSTDTNSNIMKVLFKLYKEDDTNDKDGGDDDSDNDNDKDDMEEDDTSTHNVELPPQVENINDDDDEKMDHTSDRDDDEQ